MKLLRENDGWERMTVETKHRRIRLLRNSLLPYSSCTQKAHQKLLALNGTMFVEVFIVFMYVCGGKKLHDVLDIIKTFVWWSYVTRPFYKKWHCKHWHIPFDAAFSSTPQWLQSTKSALSSICNHYRKLLRLSGSI